MLVYSASTVGFVFAHCLNRTCYMSSTTVDTAQVQPERHTEMVARTQKHSLCLAQLGVWTNRLRQVTVSRKAPWSVSWDSLDDTPLPFRPSTNMSWTRYSACFSLNDDDVERLVTYSLQHVMTIFDLS